MDCVLSNLAAFDTGCKNVGGVRRFFYWQKSARIADGVTISETAGAATISAGGTATPAYEVIPEQDNWNLTQPITDNNALGTSFVTQTFQGNIMQLTPALAALIDDLRKGRFEILAELENGELVVLGLSFRGMQTGGGDAGFSGTAIGDAQGANIIFTSESKNTAPLLADIATFEAAFTVNSPA